MNFRRKSYQNTISNAPFISYRQTFRYNLWSYQVEFQTAKKLSMQLIEIQCKLWEHFNWYNVKRQAKLLRPCPPNFSLNEKKIFLNILKRPPKTNVQLFLRVKVHWWKYKYSRLFNSSGSVIRVFCGDFRKILSIFSGIIVVKVCSSF